MASVMVIESEVFGCCVEEIDVLIEISIEGFGFAAPQVSFHYRQYYLRQM